MAKVLVTGGTGYIGSHTVVELLSLGYEVVIIDNFSNSDAKSLDRIENVCGQRPTFYKGDICNNSDLYSLFDEHRDISSIIHFAAYKAVGESVDQPIKYYRNNIDGLLNILEAMGVYKVKKLIFSSSCTVYGQPEILPVSEKTPLQPANSPYGNTKQICEEIINDFIVSGAEIQAVMLRYFNPVGAHLSGLLGELPQGIPNNLMPYITQTALGIREKLMVFGSDYNTHDGTAIRDYIHVSDLADAHIKAIEYLNNKPTPFLDIFNVGTGEGYSVLQVIDSINKILDSKLAFEITRRRAGDIEKIWADSSKANNVLGWKPKYSIDDMTSSAYNWELKLRDEK